MIINRRTYVEKLDPSSTAQQPKYVTVSETVSEVVAEPPQVLKDLRSALLAFDRSFSAEA